MNSGANLHIAIEGCLGVGKTTLATKLADFRKANLVLEEFEKNPFLPDFYRNPTGNVFETEMQFLLLHYHQLKELPGLGKESITNFTFEKDLIFGKINFREQAEKQIFAHLYEFLQPKLPEPDFIIYLKASDRLIIERIRKRNRAIEQTVDVEYFLRLKRSYDDAFLHRGGNVHVVDADRFDCLNDTTALKNLGLLIDSVAARVPCR